MFLMNEGQLLLMSRLQCSSPTLSPSSPSSGDDPRPRPRSDVLKIDPRAILRTGASRLGRFARGGTSVDNDTGDVDLRICYEGFDRRATSTRRDLTVDRRRKGAERDRQSVHQSTRERKREGEREGKNI